MKLMLTIFCIACLFTSCEEDQLNQHQIVEEEIQEETQNQSTSARRPCGHAHHVKHLMENPEYREAHRNKLQKMERMSDFRSDCNEPELIAVAIHFQNVSSPDEDCLRELAQNQIDILNADFAATNDDINQWTDNASSSFPGVNNGVTCVRFCIADQNHPSGFGLVDGDPAVTFNQVSGDQSNAWSGYLNIFVRPNLGFLGYAPLGGSGNGDGVVIDAGAFGSGAGCGQVSPEAPYNLGRTTTHEVGHYLLLEHIWGNNGGCGDDDGVSDTPVSNDSYGGCPSVGQSSCGSTDMHMNYMDYTNDACMYMFSAGQSTRMDNYVSSSLSILTNNAPNVCSEQDSDEEEEEEDPQVCELPLNMTIDVLSESQAKLSVDNVPNATRYRFQYRESGSSSWTSKASSQPSVTISGLKVCKSYQTRVRATCPVGNSPWTSVKSFSTIGCDEGCEAEAIDPVTGEPLEDEACIEEVIQNDSYCCEVEWDGICQEAYEDCSDTEGEGCVPSIDPYTGQYNDDDECVEWVQSIDPYCCEVEWDWVCQYEYDDCTYGFAPQMDLSLVNTVKLHGQYLSYRAAFAKRNVQLEILTSNGQVIMKKADLSRKDVIDLAALSLPPSGVIYVRLQDGDQTITKELVL